MFPERFVKRVAQTPPGSEWCALESLSTAAGTNINSGALAPCGSIDDARAGEESHDETSTGIVQRCRVDFKASEACEVEPNRMGNFTTSVQLRGFAAFPVVPDAERRWSAVTEAQRAEYWALAADPFDTGCATCRGHLAQRSMLYGARRWWCVPAWHTFTPRAPNGEKRRMQTLALARDAFVGTTVAVVAGEQPPPPDAWSNISLAAVTRLVFCLPSATAGAANLSAGAATGEDAAFLVIKANTTAIDGAAGGTEVHALRFAIPAAGVRCVWRTLQMLFLDGAGKVLLLGGARPVRPELLPSQRCGPAEEAAAVADALTGGDRSEHSQQPAVNPTTNPMARTVPMPPDARLPYLPCMRPGVGGLQKRAQRQGHMDSRYLTFWPSKCDAAYVGPGCSRANATSSSSAAPKVPHRTGAARGVKVAVTVSGYVRSFSFAKSSIFAHLVYPHDADFFGVTWNVVGRVAKSKPITAKMIVAVPTMLAMIRDLLKSVARGDPAELDTRHKVEVWDHKRLMRYHGLVKVNGFPHAGMYHQLQRSMELVLEAKRVYDVVIRTRWDVYVGVPFAFAPRPDGRSFDLDLGAHCEMDGVWYPRRLVVEPDKVLRHTADTRFKLFAWQACDWMDVMPFATMKKAADVFTWIRANNVYSGAQFVEHAFFIDRGLAYQPAQLFLCLQRHSNKFFC